MFYPESKPDRAGMPTTLGYYGTGEQLQRRSPIAREKISTLLRRILKKKRTKRPGPILSNMHLLPQSSPKAISSMQSVQLRLGDEKPPNGKSMISDVATGKCWTLTTKTRQRDQDARRLKTKVEFLRSQCQCQYPDDQKIYLKSCVS